MSEGLEAVLDKLDPEQSGGGPAADAIDAELHLALQEILRLREVLCEAYTILGVAMLAPETKYSDADVVRALDTMIAAADGRPSPHGGLLPWPAPPEAA